jgi:hypothetical protein
MKWTVTLLIAAAACASGQEFSTGQAARIVIGQNPFTAQEPGTSEKLLGSASGVAYASDTLVVADGTKLGGTPQNHRVLIYRNVSSFVPGRKDAFPQNDWRCPACVGVADVVLGQPDFTANELKPAAQDTLRAPVGVAYNGRVLAVADTDNNRVLIWRSLPTVNQQKADLVVGQPDFTSTTAGTSDKRLRGPQSVWLDAANGLWVADTNNNRVLYFGEVTANDQPAKVVLGQPDMNTNQQQGLLLNPIVKADSMLSPTSVMSDGRRLFVADLGLNRVLIWNTIPAQNAQRADTVVGQPNMLASESNNSKELCDALEPDSDGTARYPARCAATLSLPRAAYSDGQRLFIADAGNDRVLVYDRVPLLDGRPATTILGQVDPTLNQASDSAEPERVASTDSFKTPVALAWDGENLYVSDTYNRRVVLYTPGEFSLPLTAVRNAASPEVYAQGSVVFSGELKKDDELSIKIGNDEVKDEEGKVVDPTEYKYKVKENDDFDDVIDGFIALMVNDPYVIATPNKDFQAIIFTARAGGVFGNDVTLATAVSPDTSTTVMTSSGANLSGGQNAARVAPFAIVTIIGENLADVETDISPLDQPLPFTKGGVEVYVDGKIVPLIAVSPTRILAQLPIEVNGSNSASAVVQTKRKDGSLTVSTGVAIPLIGQQPAIYADPGLDPRPGLTYHLSSQATGTVSVDGTAKENDVATVTIRDRKYSYTVKADDTLNTIRDELVRIISENDPEVEAFPSGNFTRIRLRARVAGPAGNGIPFGASANADANVIMSAFNSELCCANEAGALVTEDNPALPGETIVVLASGLGAVKGEAYDSMVNGMPYFGPVINDVTEFVSSLAGGKTANVLFSGLRYGWVGVYEVHLELNPDLPSNPKTELTISQSFQTSNVVTVPVVNPKSNENPN